MASHLDLSQFSWQCTATEAGEFSDPGQLVDRHLHWIPAPVPGTLAQALSLHPNPLLPPVDSIENFDWWYLCAFDAHAGQRLLLCEGLATLAALWLNGDKLGESHNMFLPLQIPVTLLEKNQLLICFRSNSQFLQQKRARPSWKTNLVDNQQLRWLRTSLLGHIPGWCPAIPVVGPWRNMSLVARAAISLKLQKFSGLLDSEGNFSAQFLLSTDSPKWLSANASLQIGAYQFSLTVEIQSAGQLQLTTTGFIPTEARWFPHTHGEPVLLASNLQLRLDEQTLDINLGQRGFRQLELNRQQGLVELVVNQQPIFCRGACWTVADLLSLDSSETRLRPLLLLAREAGMNMLRVGGTMVYESDAFYQLCAQLGIMVWQDFMFANMDYPVDDSQFLQSIQSEVEAQVERLAGYACISVYCGNSEVQQQSAMMGKGREHWSNDFFDNWIPTAITRIQGDLPYFASTPCEGALPFSLEQGLAHYYGVGAYRRPLNDAQMAQVKFTPETLGFANIPEPEIIEQILMGGLFTGHHPRWKQGVPRDSSAGWDFEDIRDHYLAQLYALNPVELRSREPQRYLELSRAISAELILRTLANWRNPAHPCRGALLWFYKDLQPGAGWGLLDSAGNPKAAYFGFKRASQQLAVYFIDRGLDGLYLTLINETATVKPCKLVLRSFLHNNQTLYIERQLELTREAELLCINEWLGYFTDLNYSYGFGPAQQDLVHIALYEQNSNSLIHDDFYFVKDYQRHPMATADIHTRVETDAQGNSYLYLSCAQHLQFVRLDIADYQCADNYFHLAPRVERKISLLPKQPAAGVTRIKGYVEAVNLLNPWKISS